MTWGVENLEMRAARARENLRPEALHALRTESLPSYGRLYSSVPFPLSGWEV